ncbi:MULTISPECIES: hypothetical protein [Streptosporangium]|uniref:ABC transporter substrate-binding protein n=1 Tax=Streptosporangium brasiliense TaxID=47480 RepID=A0ABT9QZ44_9ACTN|nr:hypothetical protein [Streptosporangium brasiliense]MDP9862238.1 hypothetical protein [Streptosporangium brasiliense]
MRISRFAAAAALLALALAARGGAYAFDHPPNTVLANVCEQVMRITPI